MDNAVRPTAYNAIIEAAFMLLNADPTSSLADIASAAGVGRATLHRHFAGREDLIRALTAQALEEMNIAADTAARDARSYGTALRNILHTMIGLGDRHWFLVREMSGDLPEVRAELDRQKHEFAEVIKGGKRENLFHQLCPEEWIAQTYDHLIHAAWEMVRDGHATQRQATDLA